MHLMKLQKKYFELVKNGQKTLELRLFDDKRRKIKIGDVIEFCRDDCPDEKFATKVVALTTAQDFEALSRMIDCRKAGFENAEKLVAEMKNFYSPSLQKAFGVVAISLVVGA